MIYFDNAATTFPKPKRVLKAVNDCIKSYCGNPGRSSHELSIKTSEKIYDAREKIAALVSADEVENVVFTPSATFALNLAIKTSIPENGHVLISDIEHNSVLRPIHSLVKKRGISYSVFSTDGDIEENIKRRITPKTTHIVSSIASNVFGRTIYPERLIDIAKKYKLKLIIDSSQAIGHFKINLKGAESVVLCAPGHKALFGIQGVGFCIFCDSEKRESFIEGGTGGDSKSLSMPDYLPDRFEAGTLPSPAIISLGAGIDFINEIGIPEIESKIKALSDRAYSVISSIKDCEVYEYGNGVVSFNLNGFTSEGLAYELNEFGICTRGGFHCAPLAHRTFGTDKFGALRISFSYFNSEDEIDVLYKAIKSITKYK